MRFLLFAALLVLAACAYQEPGMKAACEAHPHQGFCP